MGFLDIKQPAKLPDIYVLMLLLFTSLLICVFICSSMRFFIDVDVINHFLKKRIN